MVTDRERQLSQEFWARRGQVPPRSSGGSAASRRRHGTGLKPKERIFLALAIVAAVLVVVAGASQ